MIGATKNNLTEYLRSIIINGILDGKYQPGEKLPTEREFAVLTGTSRITARRAYEQLEKSGIITRQRGSGTRVSESFRGNPEDIMRIALISTIRERFAVDFIEAMEKAVTKNDALFILALTDEVRNESSVALRLVSEGVQNIIVWGSGERPDRDLFERLRVLGVNIVFFDRIKPGSYADFVGLDNHHAINTIIANAVSADCTSFIFVDDARIDYDSNCERLEAFVMACAVRNLKNAQIVKRGSDAFENVVHELKTIINKRNDKVKTAVVCVNDELAMRLAANLTDSHSKIVLFGVDARLEALNAGIISYSQPIVEMAEGAVLALENQRRRGVNWRAKEYRFKGELRR
jgi:DNA-binding LacI/PurR family transcriptional regulator